MASELVRHRVFGKDEKPTIYYFTGFNTTIKTFYFHVRFLTFSGFRVVAFEYDNAVLEGGDPRMVVDAVSNINSVVLDDSKQRIVAGIYGISLGSFFGLNAMAYNHIKKGILNTGPANLAEVVWFAPNFSKTRANFNKNKFGKSSVAQLWEKLDVSSFAPMLKSAQIICMNSVNDEIIKHEENLMAIDILKNNGVRVEEITLRRLGHGQIIIRNLLRPIKIVRFFR